MDEDDDWDFNPFGVVRDKKNERLDQLSKKTPSQISPVEIFTLINASRDLNRFVPAALDLMEQGRIIDLYPEFAEDHWTLLDHHVSYFRSNPTQAGRYKLLKKKRDYRESAGGKGYTSCFKCPDGGGEFKRLYETRLDAISAAEHRYRVSGVRLDTYACTEVTGWHLTKM